MKKLMAILCFIFLVNCATKETKTVENKILFIVSNAHFYGDSKIQT